MELIVEVAERLDFKDDDINFYGKYKWELLNRISFV